MKIIQIIISKQKYLIITFMGIFALLNIFSSDSFAYIDEILETISTDSNRMLSANFYMNNTEDIYISNEDVEQLLEMNPNLIISEALTESTKDGTIYYLSPKLKPEFIKYNLINDANADYYTGSNQELGYSYELDINFNNPAECKGSIMITSRYTVDCSTDFMVFPDEETYNQLVEEYFEMNLLTDKIFSFGSYYSEEPIKSDKYEFLNLSEGTRTTSLAHIKGYMRSIKSFLVLLVLLMLFIAFLFAFTLFLSFKSEIEKLRLIGISKIKIILNYLVIFAVIGIVFYLGGLNIYIYIVLVSLIMAIMTLLTWRIND